MRNGSQRQGNGVASVPVPKTMTGLIVAASLLAAAPLLTAAILTGITLNRLVVRSEGLVQEGIALERLGGELRDQLGALARNTRQYAAIGDGELLGVIAARVERGLELARELERLSYRDPIAVELARVNDGLLLARATWGTPPADAAAFEAAVAQIEAMETQAGIVLGAGRAAVDQDMTDLRTMTDRARWAMWLSCAALVLLAVLLAVALSSVITRPIKRMSLGIAALGHARYDQPIAIGYPQEMRRLGELLDWLRRKLAQLESEKNTFLRNVSHELKTPLATLGEAVALLQEGSLGLLSPRQREVARILSEASDDLNRRVNGLLGYAAWREGRKLESRDWFEVRPIVEHVLAVRRLSMERLQLSAELELQSSRLFGQPGQWRVVLDNLISNAIKHSPAGSAITIRAAVRNGHCQLSIRDRGPGVAEDEKVRIFEPYVRSERAIVAGIPGSGVGLSVVRETVQSHGGTTEVENANPGACFKLEWPCDQPLH